MAGDKFETLSEVRKILSYIVGVSRKVRECVARCRTVPSNTHGMVC